jgi:hypothetical protein
VRPHVRPGTASADTATTGPPCRLDDDPAATAPGHDDDPAAVSADTATTAPVRRNDDDDVDVNDDDVVISADTPAIAAPRRDDDHDAATGTAPRAC